MGHPPHGPAAAHYESLRMTPNAALPASQLIKRGVGDYFRCGGTAQGIEEPVVVDGAVVARAPRPRQASSRLRGASVGATGTSGQHNSILDKAQLRLTMKSRSGSFSGTGSVEG
jgi:hypothetical protein